MITRSPKPIKPRLHACWNAWNSWQAITNSLSCSNHSHRKRRTHSTPPTSPDPVALRIKQRLDSKGAGGWGRGGGEERRKSLRFHSRFTPLSFHSGFLPPFVAFFIFQNTAQYSKTFSYSPTLPSTRHLRNPSSRLLYSQVPTPTPPKRKS